LTKKNISKKNFGKIFNFFFPHVNSTSFAFFLEGGFQQIFDVTKIEKKKKKKKLFFYLKKKNIFLLF